MIAANTATWIIVALAASAGLFALWRNIAHAGLGKHGSKREREAFEHALKHLLTRKHEQRFASPESIAGALGLRGRGMFEIVTRMESGGLIRTVGGRIELTEGGEEWAVQIVRAHRLWERYLADDAGVPLHRIHAAADRVEHSWTPEALSALDAHLGHPTTDPHGDPIPTAEGDIDDRPSTALNEWGIGEPAVVIHVEDEPTHQMHAIFAQGLRPGIRLKVTASNADAVTYEVDGKCHSLAPALAAAVNVAATSHEPQPHNHTQPLSTLGIGDTATIVKLTDQCRGLTRRRLLDMGLTPGTMIEVEMADMIGAAKAYRVRDTIVALRKEQSAEIRVRKITAPQGVTAR